MIDEPLQTILDALPAGVNKDVLSALALELSPPILLIMFQTFLEELTSNKADLRDAVATNSFATLERIAHTTKSTAGTFGATDLYAKALEAEVTAKSTNTAQIKQITEEIIAEISNTQARFQSIVEQMSAE